VEPCRGPLYRGVAYTLHPDVTSNLRTPLPDFADVHEPWIGHE